MVTVSDVAEKNLNGPMDFERSLPRTFIGCRFFQFLVKEDVLTGENCWGRADLFVLLVLVRVLGSLKFDVRFRHASL